MKCLITHYQCVFTPHTPFLARASVFHQFPLNMSLFVLCCRPLIFSPLSQVWNLVSLSWRIRMINFTSVSVYNNRKQQVVWQHSNSKVNGNASENLRPRWNMLISIIENRFNVTSIQQNKKQMGFDISENVITAWKGEKRQRKRLTSVNVVV